MSYVVVGNEVLGFSGYSKLLDFWVFKRVEMVDTCRWSVMFGETILFVLVLCLTLSLV